MITETILPATSPRKTPEITLQGKLPEVEEGEYRLPLDKLPIMIAFVDNRLCCRYNNKTFEKWFGCTQQGIHGRHVKEIFGEEAYRQGKEYFRDALKGGESDFEMDVMDNSGANRHLHISLIPHIENREKVSGCFIFGADITIRTQAKDALRQERDFAQSLINTTQMIVLVLDLQGNIVSINPYLEKLSGYRQHEIIGLNWFKTFVTDGDQKDILSLFKAAIAGKETKGNINPIITRNGELRYIEWHDTTLKDMQGNITELLAVGQDITWHIRMLQSLHESESRYRLLAEHSRDMIARQDAKGRYLYVSPACMPLQGYTAEEITGELFYKYVHPDDLIIARQDFEISLRKRESVLSTFRLLHRDGQPVWVEINITPIIHNKNEAPVEVVSVIRDITRQKNIIQQEKRYILDHAHELRISSMGEMTTEIAHELNQPLSAITIYSDALINLLPKNEAVNQDIIKAATEIKNQAIRAGNIIYRLRELISKKEINFSSVDINALIIGLAPLIKVETRWHKCNLQLDLAESLPLIHADYVLIEQAILNIVRNGLEAMSGIEKGQRTLIISSMKNSSNEIEIEISDTGPGMSAAEIKKAFESFYSTKPSGMGIGLSVTQTIIKSHDGRIWAIPNDIGGTTFVITIPVKNNEARAL